MMFGARQTGKSTLLRRLMTPETVYINLQERTRRLQMERSPAVLAQELKARKETHLSVLIDEIQKAPALLDEIQKFPVDFVHLSFRPFRNER